jgi:hypothetical protein
MYGRPEPCSIIQKLVAEHRFCEVLQAIADVDDFEEIPGWDERRG